MEYITLEDTVNDIEITLRNHGLFNTLRAFEGFETANITNVLTEVASNRGSHFSNSKYSYRALSFTGELYGASVLALRRTLLSPTVADGNLKLLKFGTTDGLDLQTEVTVNRIEMPYGQAVNTFTFECYAPDPFFYSQELNSFEIGQLTGIGGTAIPCSVPVVMFNETGGQQPNEVTNAGNAMVYPVLYITGSGSDFIVKNNTTGKQFEIETTITDKTIVVDTQAGTVKTGSTSYYDDFIGEFWQLKPGINQIGLEVLGGVATLTVVWRDSYLGL